ncbi:nuclease-related domain-containing protein [Pseudarthrobacter sp. NS4]|uniref:nuclease-related domain-containing protein n=1 Tax=Pseudarthrobacter sp. NS4 TaxID=2973976 RepID=UPI002161C20B|nr:nuclease-related domain-containing protein [Pseudarthrobacter sp. NS4]
MTTGPAPAQLGDRVPAQAVIEELLAVQSRVRPRTTLQRIFGANPLSSESLSWYKGALGEMAVGGILERLGPEWLVLHAVPVGAGSADIDHVLIGPPGVFTLNTKNHSGQSVWVAGRTLMVAGRKTRHLYNYNAAHEAARAAKLLSVAVGAAVEVTGVVVVVEPKSLTIKARPENAAVVSDTQLLRWLSRCPRELGPREVAQIAAAAVHPGTWHRRPVPLGDPLALQQSFHALRLLVVQARRRRAAWALGIPAAGFVVLANGAQLGAAILQGLAGR